MIKKVIIGFCSLMFVMIGSDKFLGFLQPPCSLESSISPLIWRVLGVFQFMSGVLLWLPKYAQHVAGFWAVFMLVFTTVHVTQGTYDIGGSFFLAVLLGLLVWSPKFIAGGKVNR